MAIDLVVDTSAVIALTRDESTADAIGQALAASGGPVISAATLVELHIVARARFGATATDAFRAVLDAADVVTMPVDATQVELAAAAWEQFGRGNHPAGLNYGDCFSYALARHLGVPLLCVGEDFVRTDVEIVELSAPIGPDRPIGADGIDGSAGAGRP